MFLVCAVPYNETDAQSERVPIDGRWLDGGEGDGLLQRVELNSPAEFHFNHSEWFVGEGSQDGFFGEGGGKAAEVEEVGVSGGECEELRGDVRSLLRCLFRLAVRLEICPMQVVHYMLVAPLL